MKNVQLISVSDRGLVTAQYFDNENSAFVQMQKEFAVKKQAVNGGGFCKPGAARLNNGSQYFNWKIIKLPELTEQERSFVAEEHDREYSRKDLENFIEDKKITGLTAEQKEEIMDEFMCRKENDDSWVYHLKAAVGRVTGTEIY